MVYSIISVTNQVGVGTIATFLAIIAGYWAIRSYMSGVQADEIAALKDKVTSLTAEVTALRAELAQERARPDMTALHALLQTEADWKRAELLAVRTAAEEARSEHAQIVETMMAMKSALDLLVKWGRTTKVEGSPA